MIRILKMEQFDDEWFSSNSNQMLDEYQFVTDQEEEVASDCEDSSSIKEIQKEKEEPVRYSKNAFQQPDISLSFACKPNKQHTL